MGNLGECSSSKREVFLEAQGLLKTYGPTTAVNHLDIKIYKGEVLALIGGNGAGKSTLTKLLAGIVQSDQGSISIEGEEMNLDKYSPAVARKKGIRVVHQELSLCRNLTVYENFYTEQFQRFDKKSFDWRKRAKELAKEALDNVFPNHGINVNAGLSTLSIAQQQMVEIARATNDPDVKMLVLDEPTSSLPAEQTNQLQEYIKKSASTGIAYIYISHRLKEVMFLADHIYIMQNGSEKYQCPICHTSEEDMVMRMGDGVVKVNKDNTIVSVDFPINENVSVKFNNYSTNKLKNVNNQMYGGEIIALTGLEGNGQLELLQEVFFQAGKNVQGVKVNGKAAYVAGDRKKEGIFPLWSIAENTVISNISDGPLFKIFSAKFIDEIVDKWNGRLKTKCNSSEDLITSLSGGNQQKVLIARAMCVDADIILLDDPTRGVDVGTKLELYEVFRNAAKEGKLVIWRTSDDAELEYCTRLCVLNRGSIVGEFGHEELEHSSILKLAFQQSEKKQETKEIKEVKKAKEHKLYMFSLISMILLYSICGILSPAVFQKFGFELLAVGFTPFIFAALAQTFIIGLGHIDLGIGGFMGLINVVCATVLDQNTGLGILLLISLLMVYSSMGLIIYWRGIPPIIVTLGMSFVWVGTAYVLQDVPGGHVPEWMVKFFSFKNPVAEGIILWLVFSIAAAILFYRSRYGTVLRGFGNNETSMINSGWSKAKAYWATYLVAGLFAMMGGFAQSAITGASDVNASATYTMLTVAAVIIGGGHFSGGIVTHIGAVFGGISLTMISVLLGLMKVSTDFTATIQGLVLILILSLKLIRKEEHKQ
ncbi:ATP-binding cassette domain-containing protein [Petroclostridium sp. X23]|uniref:ATP-binding cassette domain-containing protein n=1 Tax=Petroclostridium sp. X23 TaxID=3045146 RepID=UPI0024ADA795|nr:ATP-binding cassette domain-containing protein [Petroclostridium sp. X23]WHH59383.1 ATP-binding cassette domain-containing protein [Petroclostridium sp. X23]